MNIALYLIIFGCKVLENALATLRLIVVANGKKMLGAILAGSTSILWIFTAGIVLVDIKKDPLKAFFFCFGTFIGSYVGSFIEQKLALGNNVLTCIIDCNNESLVDQIRNEGYAVTTLQANGMEQNCLVLLIMIPRKKRNEVTKLIKGLDEKAVVIAEKVIPIQGGYRN